MAGPSSLTEYLDVNWDEQGGDGALRQWGQKVWNKLIDADWEIFKKKVGINVIVDKECDLDAVHFLFHQIANGFFF